MEISWEEETGPLAVSSSDKINYDERHSIHIPGWICMAEITSPRYTHVYTLIKCPQCTSRAGPFACHDHLYYCDNNYCH